MAEVRVHFVNPKKMAEFYFHKDINALACGMFVEGYYMALGAIELPQEGEAAAEEIFDISNNPNREKERYELFGLCRSVSVGDIVEVDGDLFLCAPVGWKIIDITTV